MLAETLTFHCTFVDKVTLPPYKGSTLRGAFGHALKKVSCALRKRNCERCILAASCCYPLVFESEKLDRNTAGYKVRLSSKPHPYVLEPPLDEQREYTAGDSFSFTLHLFGPALRYRPQIFYAVTLMGEIGLGKKHLGRFTLNKITAEDILLYDEATKTLSLEDAAWQLTLKPEIEGCSMLRVDFLTPFRIKRDNRFQRKISFGTLARAAMRRVSSLENAYGEGEPEVDYRRLAALSDEIDIIEDETRWQEVTRYSNRQKRTMKMGGVQGAMVFSGELSPFLPFLRYCEIVHLGKQTAFGLGLIQVSQL